MENSIDGRLSALKDNADSLLGTLRDIKNEGDASLAADDQLLAVIDSLRDELGEPSKVGVLESTQNPKYHWCLGSSGV